MNFFLVRDLDQRLVGVLVESSEGTVHARLAGKDGPDDAARVIAAVLDQRHKPAFQGFPVIGAANGSRSVAFVKPGAPGFVRAMLQQLRPPLRSAETGTVPDSKVGPPDRVTASVWGAFSTAGEAMPGDRRLL